MSIVDHIAIAIDFSEPSEVALRAAFRLAAIAGSRKVTVIHACRAVTMPHHGTDAQIARLERLRTNITTAAHEAIDALCAKYSCPDAAHEIVAGRPSDVIPEAAERIGATVLVLGTHARKGLRRVFMGSVAETMLRKLTIPALVMHVGGDDIEPDEELAKLDNALIGVDVAEGAEKVVAAAVDFVSSVKRSQAKLTLVHCIEDPSVFGFDVVEDYAEVAHEIAIDSLTRLASRFATDALPIDVKVIDGDPRDELPAIAAEDDAEAIIIGTHGRGGAPSTELGSTAGQIIRRSPVLVLVVPSGKGS